jgi:SnoaL-like domain
LDIHDVDAAIALFTDDGEFRTYGRIFAGQRLRRMFETAPRGFHLCGRSLAQRSQEGATARSQLVFLPADHSEQRMAIYDDVLVKQSGRWLFSSRTVRFMDAAGELQERP